MRISDWSSDVCSSDLIDGLVVKRDVEPGDLAAPSRVPMLLGDPAEMRVTAIVDERDVPRIAVGQSALLSSEAWPGRGIRGHVRSEEHTSELQSLMRISYAVFCLIKKINTIAHNDTVDKVVQ